MPAATFRVGNNAAPLKLTVGAGDLFRRMTFRVGNNAAPLKRQLQGLRGEIGTAIPALETTRPR